MTSQRTDRVVDPRTVMPEAGAEYHEFYRTPRNRWWRGVLAIVLTLGAFAIVSSVVALVLQLLVGVTGASGGDEYANNWLTLGLQVAGIASVLPFTFLIQRWVFGIPGGFLSSVVGRFRWRSFARYAAVVVPLYVVIAVAQVLLGGHGGQKPFTGQTVALLIVILLLFPVQSATEEYMFRGVIARSVGSWISPRAASLVAGAVVSSIMFMFLHGATDPYRMAGYLIFALLASAIVWRTGGLEASSVIHACNNTLGSFVVVLLGGSLDDDLHRNVSLGPAALVSAGVAAVATAILWVWSGRTRDQRTYQPDDIVTPGTENSTPTTWQ